MKHSRIEIKTVFFRLRVILPAVIALYLVGSGRGSVCRGLFQSLSAFQKDQVALTSTKLRLKFKIESNSQLRSMPINNFQPAEFSLWNRHFVEQLRWMPLNLFELSSKLNSVLLFLCFFFCFVVVVVVVVVVCFVVLVVFFFKF